jgi:hypothetical protein
MNKIVENAWNHYQISQPLLKKINDKALFTASYENEKYWLAVKRFILDIKDKPYTQITVRQRNWLNNIIEDLKEI